MGDYDPSEYLADLSAAWRAVIEADERLMAWLTEARSDFGRLDCAGHDHDDDGGP